jgi:hypothetical protein
VKTQQHPVLNYSITFNERDHSYRDSDGNYYTSVTSLVGAYFPKFNAAETAARMSARTGQPAHELVAMWKAKGNASSAFGTLTHAYAESKVLGTSAPDSRDEKYLAAARLVDKALLKIETRYEFLGAELIVFDPVTLVAGTIDLPLRNRETGAIGVWDWKTCEKIPDDAFGQSGHPPIAHVPNSKLAHYGMQLSTYGWILQEAHWLPTASTEIEPCLIHLDLTADEPVFIPVPYAKAEAEGIVIDWARRRGLSMTRPPVSEPDHMEA